MSLSEKNYEKSSDFDAGTWMSLLGLLRPIDYLITTDNFPVWRRHLAWSKTDGDDLRTQITQRFSSNMVFMSLLLGSELMVLFNAATITNDMRKSLESNRMSDFKFWIGCVIILSVCVTVTALVATFTAWGMVSSISNENIHCCIRSSIGQYVTHLPGRLAVSALYLYMLFVVMFSMEMLGSGIFRAVFLVLILANFFQVVVAYSCFGRLIINTGAMGKERILDPELECALLPSGLHASLLIKATDRMRRRMTVVKQYRSSRKGRASRSSEQASTRGGATQSRGGGKGRSVDSRFRKGRNPTMFGQFHHRERLGLESHVTEEEHHQIVQSARAFGGKTLLETVFDEKENSPATSRLEDSMDLSELQKPPQPVTPTSNVEHDSRVNKGRSDSAKALTEKELAAKRTSRFIMTRMFRGRDMTSEWVDENECRSFYGAPQLSELDLEEDHAHSDNEITMPRASILNRSHNLSALRKLTCDSEDRRSIDSTASWPSVRNASSALFTPAYSLMQTFSGSATIAENDSVQDHDVEASVHMEKLKRDSYGEKAHLLADSARTHGYPSGK